MAAELIRETFYWKVHRRDKYGASANYLQDFVSLQSILQRIRIVNEEEAEKLDKILNRWSEKSMRKCSTALNAKGSSSYV